jgi:hypothetical protein
MRHGRSGEDRALLRQTIAVAFVRVLGLALAFATSIVLARIMGAEGFGIYSFAISVIVILRIVFEAAGTLLTRVSKWSTLKAWGTRLAKRVGINKAPCRSRAQAGGDHAPDLAMVQATAAAT